MTETQLDLINDTALAGDQKVLPFARPSPKLPPAVPLDHIHWVCRCGCTTFALKADDTAECAGCHRTSFGPDDRGWRKAVTNPPGEPTDAPVDEDGQSRTTAYGVDAVDMAFVRMAKELEEKPEGVAYFMVFRRDGSVTGWGADLDYDEMPERAAWFDRRQEQVHALFHRKEQGGQNSDGNHDGASSRASEDVLRVDLEPSEHIQCDKLPPINRGSE